MKYLFFAGALVLAALPAFAEQPTSVTEQALLNALQGALSASHQADAQLAQIRQALAKLQARIKTLCGDKPDCIAPPDVGP